MENLSPNQEKKLAKLQALIGDRSERVSDPSAELLRKLIIIRDEAQDNQNVNVDDDMVKLLAEFEDGLLDFDVFDFERRLKLREMCEVIRVTYGYAVVAKRWGEEKYNVGDVDEEDETKVPVLTSDRFYLPLFIAVIDTV